MKKLFDIALSSLYKKEIEEFNIAISALDGLNFQDKDGRSLIFYAVLENDVLATETLIEKGVNLNVSDNNGWSPLHYSVNEHLVEITKLLLDNGADVNAKDSYGNTVIWRAVFASKGRGEIIELLLENNADPAIANDSGVSAYDLAKSIGNYNVTQFFKDL